MFYTLIMFFWRNMRSLCVSISFHYLNGWYSPSDHLYLRWILSVCTNVTCIITLAYFAVQHKSSAKHDCATVSSWWYAYFCGTEHSYWAIWAFLILSGSFMLVKSVFYVVFLCNLVRRLSVVQFAVFKF